MNNCSDIPLNCFFETKKDFKNLVQTRIVIFEKYNEKIEKYNEKIKTEYFILKQRIYSNTDSNI